MDELLTVVKTTKPKAVEADPEPETFRSPRKESGAISVSSPDQMLALLREQPDVQAVRAILHYLKETTSVTDGFNIKAPLPLSAQVINALVNDVAPNYWETWPDHPVSGREKELLLECLRSVSGLGAIVARLKTLTSEAQRQQQHAAKSNTAEQQIRVLLELLGWIFQDKTAVDLWADIRALISAPTQRKLLWREFVSLTATGRITSIAAQATDVLKAAKGSLEPWFADGVKFAQWVGCSAALIVSESQASEAAFDAALLLAAGRNTDDQGHIVWGFLMEFPIKDTTKTRTLQNFISKLRSHEQRQFLFSFLDVLSKRILTGDCVHEKDLQQASTPIASSTALLQALIFSSDPLKDSLVAWLISPTSGSAGASIATRRVAVAALQSDEDRMCKVMERCMEQFGDELFIKHTPMLQQEALVQTLLTSCGYIHRSQPMFLFTLARSSVHMRGTSNRLGTSSTRARFLGMVVAMAISDLIDKPDNKLKFDVPETESAEAEWYRGLPQINDSIGNVEDFEQPEQERPALREEKTPPGKPQTRKAWSENIKKQDKPDATGPRIIEIMDGSDEDDDLVPYAKPDSDPEDETEDPTTTQRNKPTAPVYVRDLLAGLREKENYDRHELALSNAARLIRRKTDFGKEVKDNAGELAAVLIGLNDQFDIENFQEMRQQALIAVLLAEPIEMGPFFVKSFYGGDYSFSQRIALLTAIGLGAREMAGFTDGREEEWRKGGAEFPSKMLPEKLHKLYSAESNPVDAITNQLKHTMISPLALDAADKVSGPNALKVRTFSSRMEVEKRRKVITNELAKIVAHSFFFPLTGGWWVHAKTMNSNIYHSAHILPTFLKTLAILIHSSGPSTFSLPQMTSEMWDLLLSVRTQALGDASVLEATLFAFLTLLEVNEDQQRLVQEHSRELLETQEWVKLVFDRTSGGSDEEERVRTLAAGVLVRSGEMVEKHQRLLMGDMMDF